MSSGCRSPCRRSRIGPGSCRQGAATSAIALIVQVERDGPVCAADLQNVAEQPRVDTSAVRASRALNEGVDDMGRPMLEDVDCRQIDIDLTDAVEHAVDEIFRPRQRLCRTAACAVRDRTLTRSVNVPPVSAAKRKPTFPLLLQSRCQNGSELPAGESTKFLIDCTHPVIVLDRARLQRQKETGLRRALRQSRCDVTSKSDKVGVIRGNVVHTRTLILNAAMKEFAARGCCGRPDRGNRRSGPA